jgi:GDPmannose 4,6-dehydratase
MPRALITGISGQDGHYLSRLLLARGYDVVGVSRRAHGVAAAERLTLRDVDVTDDAALERLFADFDFDEVYNLAGESFGPASWERPAGAARTLGVAVIAMLELIRQSGRPIRFFQASSSELFGQAAESPQRESTPFRPVTPYGFAKLMAHSAAVAYRERFGIFACCGILFNHESPLRRPEFVTRKVTREAARIRAGLSSTLRLGSLEARRDWAFAGDVAEGMWRMLQAPEPDDFVLASGESHSVRELCDIAFAHAGLDYRDYVVEEPELIRAGDFARLGDPSKAAQILGWRPAVTFAQLVAMMVDEEC